MKIKSILCVLVISFILGIITAQEEPDKQNPETEKQEDEYYLLADQYENKAYLYYKQRNFKEAAILFAKASEAEKMSKKIRLQKLSVALSNAGYCFFQIEESAKALEYLLEAKSILKQYERMQSLANISKFIGTVYLSLENYKEAIKNYQEAKSIYEQTNKQKKMISSIIGIANAYRLWEKYSKALEYCEMALSYAKDEEQIADLYNNIGSIHYGYSDYEKALEYYKKAKKIYLEVAPSEIADTLNNMGLAYKSQGKFPEGIKYLKEALENEKKSNNTIQIINKLNIIGTVYYEWGKSDEALEYFKEAITIADKSNRRIDVARTLNNIGELYHEWGKFDEALNHFELAYDLGKNSKTQTIQSLNYIGLLHLEWGKYDRALKYFEEVKSMGKDLGWESSISTTLINIGLVYKNTGEYKKSLKCYEEAKKLTEKMQKESKLSCILNNMGVIYFELKKFEEAIQYYEESLKIAKKLHHKGAVATSLNNIGVVYKTMGKYQKAMEYYTQALKIDSSLKREAAIATRKNNIGCLYYKQKQYNKAIENLTKAIELYETLLTTAKGRLQREYFETMNDTYQYLASSYIRSGNKEKTYEIVELSKGKELSEQMKSSKITINTPILIEVQNYLGNDESILIFSNTDLEKLIYLTISKQKLEGGEKSGTELMNFVSNQEYKPLIDMHSKALKKKRQENIYQKQEQYDTHIQVKNDKLTAIILFYNQFIQDESTVYEHDCSDKACKTCKARTTFIALSKELYKFLIKPLEKDLEGKTELIIIPDGILGYLPFETLMDENGTFLGEKYTIQYLPSVKTFMQLKNRKERTYKKEVIAFGGAVYDEETYEEDMQNPVSKVRSMGKQKKDKLNTREIAYLRTQARDKIGEKKDLKNLYKEIRMGDDYWNLPGTLKTAEHIKNLYGEKSNSILGKDFNENLVKELSKTGKTITNGKQTLKILPLKDYRIIHFGAHGFITEGVPELSGIVLSQLPETQMNGEDGHLHLLEISNLDLPVELITLSACVTGIGEIYSGEGVVGLPHAFLQAGANGMIVTLWEVEDYATDIFMKHFYGKLKKTPGAYKEALKATKQTFIDGSKYGAEYKSPFYWAPFVYYGK